MIINVLLVSVAAVASLLLPDRMSNIINKGIKEEIVFETTSSGDPIYFAVAKIALGTLPSGEPIFLGDVLENIPRQETALPKINYNNAGYIVTYESEGKHYAQFDLSEVDFSSVIGGNIDFSGADMSVLANLGLAETDADGNPVYMKSVNADGTLIDMPVPKFWRTSDGTPGGTKQQGTLVLQDNGLAQVSTKTVTVMSEIWKNCLIMLAITFGSSICSLSAAYFSSRIGNSFGRDLRKSIFSKVIGFSAKETDSFGTSSLITRATNDVTQIQNLVIMALRMIVTVPVMFAGGLFMALRKSPDMTLVLVAIIPIVAGMIFIVGKKILPLFKSMQKKTDKLTLIARESITGVRVIRAFGGDNRENARFNDANLDLSMTGLKAARYMSVLFPFMMLVMTGTSLAIVMVGANFVNNALQTATLNMNTISTLGNMMAVIQYVMQIMLSVIMLAMIFIIVPRASVSGGRINEILTSEPSITNKEKTILTSERGRVSFKNVSFAYSNAENNVLEDISFEAYPGEVTAIIGSTGSGKSTLISLIPRLYDVTSGSVSVDGVDVRDMNLKELRSKIGYVSQAAVLFSGTIEENIAYGNPGATHEDVVHAAEVAQAKDFIEVLDKQYGSVVEHGGANFSGGQKQRISIARAIARKPEIYIFDDSFSAVDFKTDAQLRRALKKEICNSTIFIVAQRIGTVMDADRIIVLADGKIAGIGRHRELLKNCAVYKEIALSQLSHEELGLSPTEA
jgi:ATP-binding cassette subfamily B protein